MLITPCKRCRERFTVCTDDLGEDVVPSSNPASPRCVGSQEALCVMKVGQRASEQDEWTENFTEVDVHSLYFSVQDLFLPEEVLISDNLLKSCLPSLTTLQKRLKPYPVSDLLDHTGSLLYAALMIREFSLYSDGSYDGSALCSPPHWDVEEYGNETILDAEDLMLPDFIETDVTQNQELITRSLIKHREALNLIPEPVEEHSPVLDTLRKGVVTSDYETFNAPVMDIPDPASERAISPLPFRSGVELDMDLILSPPTPLPHSDWKLSTSHLSAETLSPVDRVCLLSDRECEALEKGMWEAEKCTQDVARHLLAEPEIPALPVKQHSLSQLLSCLQAEPECDDTDRSCYPSLLPLMTPDPILTQALSAETHTAVNTHRTQVDMTEEFTPLSLTQIDELMGDSESLVSPVLENRDTTTFIPKPEPESGPNPLPYSNSVMDSYNSSLPEKHGTPAHSPALHHPVRAPDTHTILLKSTSHTHTALRRENQLVHSDNIPHTTRNVNSFSERVTQQRSFRLHFTYTSACNDSAKSTAVTLSSSENTAVEGKCSTRENHQRDLSTPRTSASPSPPRARSNNDTASELLQSHQLLHNMAEKEEQVETFTHTQSGPANHLLSNNPSKNTVVLEPLSTPHTRRDTVSHTPKHISIQTPTPPTSPHHEQEKTPHSGSGSRCGTEKSRTCMRRPREFLDPVSSFMMLRGVLRFQEEPEVTPICTTVKHAVAKSCLESTQKPTDALDRTVVQQVTEKKMNAVTETSSCITIHVPPTDTERGAYWELHALAHPLLSRALGSGSLTNKDFSSLTPEHTRFCLKEQEKLLSTGRGKECDYNSLSLLHILVTLKELLLRCDLNTATDHLERVHSTCTIDSLGELLRKFQVLQYLNTKWAEPWVRMHHLQEHISAWLQTTCSQKILIVIAVENIRAELVMALNQIPGNSVSALIPEQDSRVNIQNLTESRCVVVCVQHLQSGFPWWNFSAVLEFQCLVDSAVRSICTMNKIMYTCFTTAPPLSVPDSLSVVISPLDAVPFVLFITEGLVKYCDLLQLLESTYNMTLLERMHSPSLQRLGPTHLYDIITVDENTVILLQELGELEQERTAERVVLRLSALSLQFNRCCVLLHFSNHYSALVRGEVFRNLTLIYSALVLFGQKSEGLDVKVLLAYNITEIAHYVHQVCLHTLLNSQRDVCSWLARESFSALPTEEEQCLLCFPCVNNVVAQLLMSRAPSLQWLLEASHVQLAEMFPDITHSIIKIFSDITSTHRPSVPATQCEDEHTLMHYLDNKEPLPHTPPSSEPFFINSSLVTNTPGFIQEPGTLGNGHFREESVCLMRTHAPNMAEEHTQGAFSGVDDVYADNQWNPSLTFTHTHSVPSTPFTWNPYSPTPPSPSYSTHQHWGGISNVHEKYTERKRPGGGALDTVFPQSKRGRLVFERVPGRSDGQTQLRFF